MTEEKKEEKIEAMAEVKAEAKTEVQAELKAEVAIEPQAPAAPAAPAAEQAKPKEEKAGPVKIEKPSNCVVCKKLIKKIRWYYRNGKFYCSKRCWKTTLKKEESPKEGAAETK